MFRVVILVAALLAVVGVQADTLALTDPLSIPGPPPPGIGTLTLTDPSSIPVPPGTHADGYEFPFALLDLSNPIVSMDVDYDSSNFGIHEIVSAYLLFDPGVTYIETLLQTPDRYQARATFSIPVTDVSNAYYPGFLAVHEDTGGLTSLTWTATYMDGSQRVAIDGIIPEPTTVSLLGLGALATVFTRRQRNKRNSKKHPNTKQQVFSEKFIEQW